MVRFHEGGSEPASHDDLEKVSRRIVAGFARLDDRQLSVPLYGPGPCLNCVHLHSRADRSCAAFDVIPDGIWLGYYGHRTPWPGDGGVRFEQATRTN